MFSVWLFYIVTHAIGILIIAPYIDKNLSPLSRFSRMTITHRVFSLEFTFFSFFNIIPLNIDSDSKALEHITSLYHPHVNLNDNITINDIENFRYHSKRMLIGLHPPQPSTCIVENHLFKYNDNLVNMYSIQHDKIDDWKNSNQPFVLYFHGGGFITGDIDTYSGFECHLSKQLDMLIMHVDFSLIPEYPLTKTIEDVIGVYEILLDVDPNIHKRLIGMGDSTGGMLWIYLLQWIISNNKPVPKGVVLHSPWPNLEFLGSSIWLSSDTFLPLDLAFSLRQLAIGSDKEWHEINEEERRRISPHMNLFERFPPIYVTAGTNEIFIDDTRTMVEKMKEANVEVILDEGEGLMHSFSLFHLWSPKARCVQENIRQWIEQKLRTNMESL